MFKRCKCVLALLIGTCLCFLAGCGESDLQEEQPLGKQIVYTVNFYQGDTCLNRQRIPAGEAIAAVPGGAAWQDENGMQVEPRGLKVTRSMDFYVQESSYLTRDHRTAFPYEGEGDRYHPDDTLTRGEAAQLIYGLLAEPIELPKGTGSAFMDVQPEAACYGAVRMLTVMGLLKGDGSGQFYPDRPITRAELAVFLCRAIGLVGLDPESAFADVTADHWAADSINAAAEAGWLAGHEDGLFYPDRPVTRAEAMVMVNRARSRTPNRTVINTVCEDDHPYVDVPPGGWAYYDVIDLTYDSDFYSYITGEKKDAEPGFVLLGDRMCHVNPETLRLDYYEGGFHTIEDGLDSDGLYYVEEDGYFIQRFWAGYLEMDGSMFYVPETDGPFLTDGYKGYLYFGENGRYTSGSATVDAYVDELLSGLNADPTYGNLRKLYLAYCMLRDGGYSFMTRNTGWKRGATGYELKVAEVFFQTKRGACFYWSAGFMYLARRLGYQARAVIGGAGGANEIHSWVMINIDGTDYIFDPEMEWAINYGHFYNAKYGRMVDLFMQPRYSPNYEYHFP